MFAVFSSVGEKACEYNRLRHVSTIDSCKIIYRDTLWLKSILEMGWSHRYAPEIPEQAPSWSWHVAEFEGLIVFPVIKITVVHQVCMLPACTAIRVWRQTRAICFTVHEDRECIFLVFVFLHVWLAKIQKTPKLSPMAEDTITRGDIGGLGSLYICGWSLVLLGHLTYCFVCNKHPWVCIFLKRYSLQVNSRCKLFDVLV